MTSTWRDHDRIRSVELRLLGPRRWRVCVDDSEFDVEAEAHAGGRLRLVTDQGVVVAEVTAAGARRFVRLGTLEFVVEREAPGRRRRGAGPTGGLDAPMPGTVTRVMVADGDRITHGQPLVAIEAMKMEHVIRAPRDGRVKLVRARTGDMVAPGTALVELEADGGGSGEGAKSERS